MASIEISKAAAFELSDALPGKVSFSSDEAYKRAQESYFIKQNQDLKPLCHVAPTSAHDVSVAIKVLRKYKDVRFAVRGGGHTLNTATANLNDGIVINLRELNKTEVREDRKLASIGGGSIWVEVYEFLSAQGLSAPGGRVSTVGVGGLTTGGGISFFSNRYGLVCDNVENFEIVTSTGDIISANRQENADLWWALKGGSGTNFGIVTRFDIVTFEQGDFLGGMVIMDPNTQDEQFRNYGTFLDRFDPYAAIIFSITWNQTMSDVYLLANLEYTKEGVLDPDCFKPFRESGGVQKDTLRVSSLADFTIEAGLGRTGLLNRFATTTFAGGFSMVKKAHEIWKSYIPSISDVKGMNWSLTIQPIWPAYSSRTADRGGNALGLDPSDEPLTLLLISWSWENESDEDRGKVAAQKYIADVDNAAKEAGAYRKFRYLNYCASWQDPFAGYVENDLKRLKDVASKYDPESFFQICCPGGFKLINA